jgi:hypothetical protein
MKTVYLSTMAGGEGGVYGGARGGDCDCGLRECRRCMYVMTIVVDSCDNKEEEECYLEEREQVE